MNRRDIPALPAGSVNWRTAGDLLLHALWPSRCPVCGEILEFGGPRCHAACRQHLTWADSGICEQCGILLADPGEHRCSRCTDEIRSFDAGRGVWLHDRIMAQSIYEFKYAQAAEYARFYAEEMYRLYGDLVRRWEVGLIIPVPIHGSKLAVRGYNQAHLVAREFAKLCKLPEEEHILFRISQTRAQKGLGRQGRLRSLKKAFYIPEHISLTGNVLLIDDIYTTGNTMEVCAQRLKERGARRVYFLTVTTGSEV